MIAAYRDGGAFTLCLHAIWVFLSGGRRMSFPPRGFVGQGSLLLAVTDLRHSKLVSIHLRRAASTRDVPPWRLTYGWVISPLPPPLLNSGACSGRSGKRRVGGGGVSSRRSIRTISISNS